MPFDLDALKDYAKQKEIENELWKQVAVTIRDRSLTPMDLPSNTPFYIEVTLPDETKEKVRTGTYGGAVAVVGPLRANIAETLLVP